MGVGDYVESFRQRAESASIELPASFPRVADPLYETIREIIDAHGPVFALEIAHLFYNHSGERYITGYRDMLSGDIGRNVRLIGAKHGLKDVRLEDALRMVDVDPKPVKLGTNALTRKSRLIYTAECSMLEFIRAHVVDGRRETKRLTFHLRSFAQQLLLAGSS